MLVCIPSPIRVVVADDHPIVRKGICQVLSHDGDISVVGEAKNGLEAIELVDQRHPDILVTDIDMPGMDGLTAARQLREQGNPVKILVLSAYSASDFIREALKIGVEGYLRKDDAPTCVTDAVHRIVGGEKGVFGKGVGPVD